MGHQHRSGTVMQSGLKSQASDYGHEFISHPVLGIVLNVYFADHPINQSSNDAEDHRGTHLEARVLVINDGSDSPWVLPNVVIAPSGASGVDNYCEEVPRGVTSTVSGEELDSKLRDRLYEDLDGEMCVVDFIGGSTNQPFMVQWWPHPANKKDPATSDIENRGHPAQGRRIARRFQGTRFGVTRDGTVLLDTSQANHLKQGPVRQPNDKGGDLRVTVKSSRTLEVNFNPSVFGDPDEPDFLFDEFVKKVRDKVFTQILADKDFIRLLAGKLVEIAPAETIALGKEGSATENFVLGQSWKSLMERIIDTLLSHVHPTGVGPSGQSVELANDLPGEKNNLSDHLSTWIFGQKDPPV